MHTARAPSNRVFLHKIKRKKRTVWMLKHLSTDGNQVSETIGKVGEMTKKDAMALQRKKQSDLDGGKIQRNRPQKISFAAFAEVYKERRRQGDTGRGYLRGSPRLCEASITSHVMTLRYLIHHFGKDRIIESVTLADAEQFIERLAAGELIGARTAEVKRNWGMGEQNVRKHIRNCKTVYNWGKRFGFVSGNPFDDFDGKPIPTKANHYLPQIDFERIITRLDREADCLRRLINRADRMIIAASPSKTGAIRQRRRRMSERLTILPGWRVMFALCRLAGLRRSEVLNLPWSGQAVDRHGEEHWIGVDWNRRRIHLVAVKTRMFREVPINPRLYEILLDAFDKAEEGAIRVTDLSPNNLTRLGQRIIKAAGLSLWPKIFQAMRSSAENDLKRQGIAEATYAVWMGHSPKVSRESYTAPMEEEFLSITSPEEAA